MKRKILGLFIAISMITSLIQITVGAESLGACGDSMRCKFENGILTISGEGEMDDYPTNDFPWKDLEIKKVVIESGVTYIGEHAFYSCEDIESIDIPDTVTAIGSSAFSGCMSLTEITIPNSVKKIGESLFRQCWKLSEVTLSKKLNCIPRFTFYDCPLLQHITIPEGVSMIGDEAFCETSLIDVTIPQSVMIIGEQAFDLSYYKEWFIKDVEYLGLEDVYYDGTETQWNNIRMQDNNDDLKNADIHYSNTDRSFGTCGDSVSWKIKNKVLNIYGTGKMRDYYPAYPLWFVYDYNTIQIDEGVTYIGEYSFDEKIVEIEHCFGGSYYSFNSDHVERVYIPKSVTEIGYGAFDTCTKLTDVYYGGTKSEWENIKINGYNDSLLNANIHYNATMPEIYEPLEVNVSHAVFQSSNKVKFTVSAKDEERADELSCITLFAAEYDCDGVLINVQKGVNSVVSGNSVTITADLPSSVNYKYMLWDNLYPLMNTVTNIYTVSAQNSVD